MNDNTNRAYLEEYAHAARVATVAKSQWLRSIGSECQMRHYVDSLKLFNALASMWGAKVRQVQRTESLRVLEFEHGGLVWVCGLAQCR